MGSNRIRGSARQSEQANEITDGEQCGLQIGCGRCKIGRYPISCLNVFNNSRWALVFLSISSFLQGAIVNGISSVVISTLERRFHLRSSETGFIAACYEIGVCISIPVVTFIGGRGHKTLWIGWGMFIMGAGSIVFSLPHFVAPPYIIPDIDALICNSTFNCDAADLRSLQSFFIVGQILLGVGASPIYTIALNYLDENVKEVYSSTYHGIYFASALLGPGAGFLVGGYLLAVFVDFNQEVDITNESIFWIGNWWIAFLISGALMIMFSIPVLLYPKQLPFTEKVRLNRESEMQNQRDAVAVRGDEKFGKRLRDLPRCLLIVLKNPVVIFISLSAAMDSGLASAFSAFGTKYIETMFSLPSATAALYYGGYAVCCGASFCFLWCLITGVIIVKIGATVVVFACSGNVLSGILVTKLKMTVPTMIKFCIAATLGSLCCVFVFLLYCPTPDVAGVNVPYNGNSEIFCQMKCSGCTTDLFSPVCGADGLTYTSFCSAGCNESDTKDNFVNCSRISMNSGIGNSSALSGKCKVEGCLSLGIFLAFGGLLVFFGYLKSQSGIQWLIIRVFGQIPLPIILGKILDLSCIVWGEECGQCGACKMYDGPSMATLLTSLGAVVKVFSLACLLLTWKVYKPVSENISIQNDNGRGTSREREETFSSNDIQRHSNAFAETSNMDIDL